MPPGVDEKVVQKSRGLHLDWKELLYNAAFPVAGMLVALLVGAVMLLLLKV